MTITTRIALALALTLSLGGVAQETTTQPVATSTASTTTASEAPAEVVDGETSTAATSTASGEESEKPSQEGLSSHETRTQFATLLQQHPYDLATVLALDPALLLNKEFVARYPELERFLQAHPEVLRNPGFYVADFRGRDSYRERSILEEVIETVIISATMLLIAFALAWIVRTIVEQKRWNRLSRTQSEVHNKILDRFATSEELLNYVKSPAGSKFLESAPIPLRAEEPAPSRNAPLSRIMWSIQLGVVLAVGAVGLLLVSLRFDAETGQDLFALGMIAFSIGIGFIASAIVSIVLSRRLGIWQGDAPAGGIAGEPGGMR
jgi:hypothetical protein